MRGFFIPIQCEKKFFYHFETSRIDTKNTHGTGCTFSSAIASQLVPIGVDGLAVVSAVITCFIVNYAVDGKSTWSLLVAGSCIFAYLVLFMMIFGGKHRILLTYAAICIMIIPYLYVVEKIANLYVTEPAYWALSFGAPISIFWLGECGIIAFFRRITHANGWIIAGISVLAIYAGERFTNFKLDELWGGSSDSWQLSDHYPIIYFGTAAVLLFIGVILAAARLVGKNHPAKD